MKLKVMMDNGDARILTVSDGKTFEEFVRNFFSARYYVLGPGNAVGNTAIDTFKVCTVEIVEVA